MKKENEEFDLFELMRIAQEDADYQMQTYQINKELRDKPRKETTKEEYYNHWKTVLDEKMKEILSQSNSGDEFILSFRDYLEKLGYSAHQEILKEKETLYIERPLYRLELRPKFSKEDWRTLLIQRVIEALFISAQQLFDSYSDEVEWSFYTRDGDAWKNEQEIIEHFMWDMMNDSTESSEFKKFSELVRKNLTKLNNGEIELDNYGKDFDITAGVGVQSQQNKELLRYEYSFNSIHHSFDWRLTVPMQFIPDVINSVIVHMARYKKSEEFSKKTKNKKYASKNIKIITEDFIRNELKNVLKVVRKNIESDIKERYEPYIPTEEELKAMHDKYNDILGDYEGE